jgi:NaMN:DMB phosphoribosyltransferase
MDVLIANNELKAKAFLEEIEAKNPLFICTIATTETGKIPGLSAAGANPDFTDFTPPADAELLLLGKCKSIRRSHYSRRYSDTSLDNHLGTAFSRHTSVGCQHWRELSRKFPTWI